MNETLRGPPTADDVATLAAALMRKAGIERLRKNTVLAIELVFSLPAETTIDSRAYFVDCVAWAASYFGGDDNILSADIHNDEGAPHCHVLLLPLRDGRMLGSDMVGDRRTLAKTQQDFRQRVALPYGLRAAPTRLAGPAKYAGALSVIAKLRSTNDKALASIVWPQLRDAIEADPAPYMLALNLEAPKREMKMRTMTQIFTSKGSGKNYETKPIGFAAEPESRALCSVGFAPTAPMPAPRRSDAPTATHADTGSDCPAEPARFAREREEELDPSLYDTTTGEFRNKRNDWKPWDDRLDAHSDHTG